MLALKHLAHPERKRRELRAGTPRPEPVRQHVRLSEESWKKLEHLGVRRIVGRNVEDQLHDLTKWNETRRVKRRIAKWRKENRNRWLIRMLVRARAIANTINNPGGAIAVSYTGETYPTAPVVTPQLVTLRDVREASSGSGLTEVLLHNVPAQSLDGVSCKVRVTGGMHGETKRAHPACGTFTLIGTANPYVYELTGCTWVAGSLFGGGYLIPASVTPIEAVSILNAMSDWAEEKGPTYIRLPLGNIWLESATLRWPSQSQITGAGGAVRGTVFIAADTNVNLGNSIHTVIMGMGVNGTYQNGDIDWSGFAVYGDRLHAPDRFGGAVISLGGTLDEDTLLRGSMTDIWMIGSVGYSLSFGNNNSKQDFVVDKCGMLWCGSDAVDIKNSEDNNARLWFLNCQCHYWAMRDQGTDKQNTVSIVTDGITTTASSTTCKIPLNIAVGGTTTRERFYGARVGDRLTISGAATGNGVDPNGDWTLSAIDATHYSFVVDDTATGTGGIGGSAIKATWFRRLDGTDVTVGASTVTNTITTVAGTTWCKVPRLDVDAYTGRTITISGATTGDGVNPNGSWHMVDVDSTHLYFDTGQTPSVGGVEIGGTDALWVVPHINAGDAAIDLRGNNHVVHNWYGENELVSLSGLRSRAGIEEVTVAGGAYASMTVIRFKDTSASWIAETDVGGDGSLVSFDNPRIHVHDVVFNGTGCNIVIGGSVSAQNCRASKVTAHQCYMGILSRGENCHYSDMEFIDPTACGVENWGFQAQLAIRMGPNPCTNPTIGSAVTRMHCPAHGQVGTIDIIRFLGPSLDTSNGVIIRSYNTDPPYSATVIDADTVEITAAGAAISDSVAWGGDESETPNVAAILLDEHDAIGNIFDNIVIRCTDDDNSVIGFANGYTLATGLKGRATDARIRRCGTVDVETPLVDYGTNLVVENCWGGLEQYNRLVTTRLQAPVLDTDTWTLLDSKSFTAGSSLVEFTHIYARDIFFAMDSASHANSVGANIGMLVSSDNGVTWLDDLGDYLCIGEALGTGSVVLSGSMANSVAASAHVLAINFGVNQKTRFAIQGGHDGVAAGQVTQDRVTTAAAVHNAIRIITTGGFDAGTFYLWGRGFNT